MPRLALTPIGGGGRKCREWLVCHLRGFVLCSPRTNSCDPGRAGNQHGRGRRPDGAPHASPAVECCRYGVTRSHEKVGWLGRGSIVSRRYCSGKWSEPPCTMMRVRFGTGSVTPCAGSPVARGLSTRKL